MRCRCLRRRQSSPDVGMGRALSAQRDQHRVIAVFQGVIPAPRRSLPSRNGASPQAQRSRGRREPRRLMAADRVHLRASRQIFRSVRRTSCSPSLRSAACSTRPSGWTARRPAARPRLSPAANARSMAPCSRRSRLALLGRGLTQADDFRQNRDGDLGGRLGSNAQAGG